MAVTLVVSTQYTNVTDSQPPASQPATAQRHRPRLCTATRGKNCLKAKFRSRSRRTIDHRLLLPQASLSSFVFEMPPHATDSPVPVYHLLAPCMGSYVEDWVGLDIAACAVGKVCQTTFRSLKFRGAHP